MANAIDDVQRQVFGLRRIGQQERPIQADTVGLGLRAVHVAA